MDLIPNTSFLYGCINYEKNVETCKKSKFTAIQNKRLKEVQSLTEGSEYPYGSKWPTTVDFICHNERIEDTDRVVREIGSWTKRKKKLMIPFHIQIAHQGILPTVKTMISIG